MSEVTFTKVFGFFALPALTGAVGRMLLNQTGGSMVDKAQLQACVSAGIALGAYAASEAVESDSLHAFLRGGMWGEALSAPGYMVQAEWYKKAQAHGTAVSGDTKSIGGLLVCGSQGGSLAFNRPLTSTELASLAQSLR
jgi:hypothetical protein